MFGVLEGGISSSENWSRVDNKKRYSVRVILFIFRKQVVLLRLAPGG
jgi:hypothetical protein